MQKVPTRSRLIAVGVAAAFAVAACGSGSGGGDTAESGSAKSATEAEKPVPTEEESMSEESMSEESMSEESMSEESMSEESMSEESMSEESMSEDDGSGAAATTDAVAKKADPSATVTLDTEACDDPEAATTPVEGDWVLGYSLPLSGPVAAPVALFKTGFEGRLKAFNDAGGLDGMKIEVIYKDDAFTPDRAKANGVEFIENDKVDSLNTFGTGQLSAMADDQNAACVPLLYPSSSVAEFRDIEAYPWTVQYLPSNSAESSYDIQVINDRYPDGATVAIAENQSQSGKGYSEGFSAAAEGTNIDIIATEPTTDLDAAATAIKAANPQVVFIAGITNDCGPLTQAFERVGFQPEMILVPSNCADTGGWVTAGTAADGVVIPAFVKSPDSPGMADDPGVKLYLSQVSGDTVNNPITINGWVSADMLIANLRLAAEDGPLTRASVMAAARNMEYVSPMMMNGVAWQSFPDDMIGFNGFQTMVWNAAEGKFVPEGDIVSVGSS